MVARSNSHWEALMLELASLHAENAQLKGSVVELEALAYRDSLTGLRNRRYLEERMAEDLSSLRRHKGCPFSLIVIDLDSFKAINDTGGHAAGDRALVWIAEFLRSRVRLEDVVCRTGGDEFIILLPATNSVGCRVVVKSLRDRIATLFALGEAPVHFSLGHATTGECADRGADLIALADVVMYQNKARQSRGRPARRSVPRNNERTRSQPQQQLDAVG